MQNIKYGNAVKNDDWITENNVPDPDPLPELPGYHVLIRPVSIRKETKGGILLPDQFMEDVICWNEVLSFYTCNLNNFMTFSKR